MPQLKDNSANVSVKLALAYALVGAVGLGAITTQAKLTYVDGGNALTLMFWRFFMSVMLIGMLVLLRRQSFWVPRSMRGGVVLLGFVWSGAMIAYLLSVEYISVSVAVIVLYSYPLIVLGVSVVQGRMIRSWRVVVLFILAFVGIMFMLLNGEIMLHPLGLLFVCLAAVGAAYTFLAGERVASAMNPVVLTFWVNAIGLGIIIPLVIGHYQPPQSALGLAALAGATGCHIIAIVCQFKALAEGSSDRVAFIFNTEPVISIVLALLVLDRAWM